MIANIKILEKYCTDYKNIENYEEALKSPLRYDLHHRNEISEHKSKRQLITENLYYGRPPEELIFLEHGEHMRLHKEGDKNPLFGQHRSAETRQKISESKKGTPGPWKGKHLSAETKQKISDARKGKLKGKHMSTETRKRMSIAKKGKPGPWKGKHWHLENGQGIVERGRSIAKETSC